MDMQIALVLGQDGLVNGAIYALMALALVLVFSVTRVIFIPQGDFVAYSALSLVALLSGQFPKTVWLLLALGAYTVVQDLWRTWRGTRVDWRGTLCWAVCAPALAWGVVSWLEPTQLWAQVLCTLLIMVPLGPLLYRVVYQPLAHSSVLMLLIVSVALHGAMSGLGLFFFGAEGSRTPAFSELSWEWLGMVVSAQSLIVLATVVALVALLYVFFDRSMVGKALRATALNRIGARLQGIPTDLAGDLSFALAALIGSICGLLIAPLTTIYYDTGFLIGLKGFVAAIIGALASYPLALLGALLVGLLESFASFWASAFKEVIVFTLIIPVLWWRSRGQHRVEDEE